ncbi:MULTISPECIES: hypothetical protein [Rhodonellum]|nr:MULTISPECIES: hypothetical protein [Rhodonellum]SDZ36351.1 hypothetical protein SAMN05444412_111100 [Rhodonellum ikkaensis]
MKKYILTMVALGGISMSLMAQGLQRDMQYWRSYDQRGLNVFETGKIDSVGFEGMKVRIGGHFTQQWQNLSHSNTATERLVNGANANQLIEIGAGTNLATANLNIDVALADGIRLNLVTYLSSRHHSESWVKGGYIQVDRVAFLNSPIMDKIFEKVTLRVGHMEINYGDAHYRRSDNGNAMYNPFIGNYIMDAFTTEVGGELYFQSNGFLAMGSVTGGEIQGGITNPSKRKPSFIGKLGFDRNLNEDVRVRLTGSVYTTEGSSRNTLYGGDRAGSRYYTVMENIAAASAFTSGRINPGQTDNITAMVLNPFVKIHGFEFFGNLERSKGKAANETDDRTWNQIGLDGVYRFGLQEKFYLAARYNTVKGPLAGANTVDVSIDRVQIGGGWFVTKNILAKIEYVSQNYNDFAASDIRNGGKFNGLMIEGVIGF